MTTDSFGDPIKPRVTFDSYVISETVHEYTVHATPAPQQRRLSWPMVLMGGVSLLTFVLGVLITLYFVAPDEVATASVPADMRIAVPEAQSVTRAAPPDLLAPAAIAPARHEPQLDHVRDAVLAGLQPMRTVGKLTQGEMAVKARQAQDIVSRNKLRMLREGVLAGVYTVTAVQEGQQNRLVLQTINAEMTRKAMGDLLRKAAAEGQIELPASLSTSNGDVDMDTMLFNLIQTSLADDGTPEGAEAAREMSRRAFAASSARTRQVKGERIYIVEPGDSLAYLSLQFYGRPSDYEKIFQANRKVLTSPDRIQIGQRLIIPG